MTQRKNSRILIGGLVLAGVLVMVLITMLARLERTGSDPQLQKSGELGQSRPAPLESVASSDSAGARMATITDPALTIIAVDPAGLPLHTATIRASKGDEEFEATGRGIWDEISVGDWQIEITRDGFLDAHKKVSVIEGGHADIVITMYRSVDIRGRIIDTLGAVVPHTMIQFLREKSEAEDTKAKRAAGRVLTDGAGRFSMNLAQAGEYRIIVGAKASPLLAMEEPVELAPGVLELEVVTQGTGSVELQLTDLPELAQAKEGLLKARIYARRAQNRGANARKRGLQDPSAPGRSRATRPTRLDPPADGSTEPRPGDRPQRLNLKQQETPAGASDTDTEKLVESSGMAALGPEWSHKVSATVSPEGTASFTRLTARQEYRLVLELRRVRFQSTQSFRVDPNRLVTLQASVPALPGDAGGKARLNAILPFNLIVNYKSTGSDTPEPGFYWK